MLLNIYKNKNKQQQQQQSKKNYSYLLTVIVKELECGVE
jgi:hypothetical protein